MSYRRTNYAIRSNSLGNLVNEIATHAKNDYNSDEVPRAIHAWMWFTGRGRSQWLPPKLFREHESLIHISLYWIIYQVVMTLEPKQVVLQHDFFSYCCPPTLDPTLILKAIITTISLTQYLTLTTRQRSVAHHKTEEWRLKSQLRRKVVTLSINIFVSCALLNRGKSKQTIKCVCSCNWLFNAFICHA